MIDPEEADGLIRVQCYLYRAPTENNLIVHLAKKKDPNTYKAYLQHFKDVWNDATAYYMES